MARGVFRLFGSDENGAIAPTYALALLGLIAIAGIAFDYGRLVAMDSELQNAADQAALAAATQLDGKSGACSRAAQAAYAAAGSDDFLDNITLIARDDGQGRAVTIPNEPGCDATGSIRFWQDKEKTDAAEDDASARFVEVTADARVAQYFLTPVVGAFHSGNIEAIAMAGLGSAICRTPPVMMCNPEEPSSNTDTLLEFDGDSYLGIGIRLIAQDAYTPGSFGFLETYASGANVLLAALGWNVPPGECLPSDGVVLKNGMNTSVIDGLNTRFDMPGTNACPNIGGVTGVCWPSVNVRKDLVRGGGGSCAWDVNQSDSSNFDTRNYRPTTASTYPATKTPDIMGHPRDLCHAWSDAGNCPGDRIGTGDWDINAYWRSNYGHNYAGEVSAADYGTQPKGYPTRYQVYRYEADHLSTISSPKAGAGGKTAYSQPQAGKCLAMPDPPYGAVPVDDGIDRRRITVAVLNCTALVKKYGSLNNKTLEVGRGNWVDVFLVEPSLNRNKCQGSGCNIKYTDKKDVYVEIIERTDIAGNSDFAQTIRRDAPYLVR